MKVLATFMKSYRAANPDDTIVERDLYKENFPELDGDMLKAFAPNVTPTAEAAAKLAVFGDALNQFKTADKVIIANPMWNLGIPTKLKSWIDAITVVGQTFRYTATGHIALLPGKKVMHIQAAGGKYAGKDPATQYVHAALEYLGTEKVVDLPVEGMDHFPDQAKAIVEAAEKQAVEVGKTF
ncbi:FMN-dependent NADH-azoreductase [Lacticaseibacillus camelliae DSM 22697 = JCM 13995]|uniref:FMN dependent NADH:quinone oxidoreductase n=2 Tax=Lacticaseibacillus camelliae TaxID=381742 RepID=A0A0R2FAQ3_9LACO|nr:FMN-dependent NADH-azoreductase [Lacticaseibacillus camelliae DSM 22697 = JCM 13995]